MDAYHFVAILSLFFLLLLLLNLAAADPQTRLLNAGCSQYNATSPPAFAANLNCTFVDLRKELQKNNTHFATSHCAKATDPAYAMVQCRDYLSASDCLACFAAAASQIRRCSAANGARVIYDGCFLRYESNEFFDQTTLPGNVPICGNKTISPQTQISAFTATAESLLFDLVTATPRTQGFFAASTRPLSGSNGGAAVHAVAQCAETVSKTGCRDCLSVAYGNIKGCSPNADGRAVDAGCFLRYSDSAFFEDDQVTDLKAFLGNDGSSKKGAIIGGVVGGIALLVLVAVLIAWARYFRRKPKRGRRGDILGATELRGPVNFNYSDLKYSTKNFSEENKLGEGGFGGVYKGTLRNGKIVAVKQLFVGTSSKAKAEFESEVKLISNVHHRNLIRLLGCCSKSQELLLVYEYMANSSLDKFLFGDKRGSLNWTKRFNIILGIARGLAYLHEEFHVCIIHRDIKSSNILLDDEFQPKIADFGLARLLPADQSHLSTRFAGTLGYTAPEYAIQGKLSEKVDTYSYGVVVLEIISGRKSTDMNLKPDSQYLLEWAWKLYETGMLMDLVDESLDRSEFQWEEVKKVIEIALCCTQSSVASRPTMSEVVVLLLSKGFVELMPTRPTFIDSTRRVRGDTSTYTGSSTSNAMVSITESSGR